MRRRTRHARPPLALLVVTLAALAASACTAGSDGGGTASDVSGSTTGDGDPTAGASTDDAASERPPTPLTAFFDDTSTGDAEEMARAERGRDAYEQAVADCMADRGFTWEPRARGDLDPSTAVWNLPPEEFAVTYGYGMTTIDRPERPEGPNSDRVAAMSTAERRAYHRALYGDWVPLDDEGYPTTASTASTGGDDGEPGCTATAVATSAGQEDLPDADAALAPFEPLMADMEQLWSRVDDDPRVQDAAAAWSDCMADAGFPGFDWPDDPEDEVMRRMQQLAQDVGEDPGASAQGVPARIPTLASADPQAVEELRTYELDVATADHRCSDAFEDVRHEVQVEVEQAFVDANREQLEAYRDAMATLKGEG